MRRAPWVHMGIAAGLSLAFTAVLLLTSAPLGYARDEGFYFQAASSYEQWFSILLQEPGAALQRHVVDRYWSVNSEHPAFMKSLFALSHHFLFEKWGVFSTPGISFRFPAMLLSGLGVGFLYLWGSETVGGAAALVAALLFAVMPHVFHHAHLACFDMPVAALSLFTAYAYWKSLRRGSFAGMLCVGLLYGLFLNTKHNSWLFPFAALAHSLCLNHRALFAIFVGAFASWGAYPKAKLERISGQIWPWRFPPALLGILLIGPLVFFLTWPWIWFETVPRLRAYAAFHLGHVYYNMEFLGQTYWKPPMPHGYAWVMTLGTVPLVTLTLFTVGLVVFFVRQWPARGSKLFGASARLARIPMGSPRSAVVLWILSVLVNYAPWWSSDTPIFGGTKHWLTAYPFMCLVAGVGVRKVLALATRAEVRPIHYWARAASLSLFILVGPFVMTWHSFPFGLSAYTPLVGGASGAANLGLNRTFWGYTSASLFEPMNRLAPPSARVYVHDTALQSWDMHWKDGQLRRDLFGTLNIARSDLALFHHEPHMQRVEYQIWSAYGTAQPTDIILFDGVPVVWLYKRP
ncbi:MAG: glycosyltransferase family 39 protein [Polyangiaceae bacterium]|nr:glycosyltransferase family 39 protein [Polyangiaceae bacterium]